MIYFNCLVFAYIREINLIRNICFNNNIIINIFQQKYPAWNSRSSVWHKEQTASKSEQK